MSTDTITPTTLATNALRSSWRDALTLRYELDQAKLRVSIDNAGQVEEYL